MKILNLYVTKGILVILLAAVLILTFGMLGGQFIQALAYLSQGVPFSDFLYFMLYISPMMLTYTIPWGILVAVLLLFGQMSATNEITAMRACGISIFQIITPLIILTSGLTVLCLYFQCSLAPYYYGKAGALMKDVATRHPDALITPGTPCDFGNMVVYVKNKKGVDLQDVQIFSFPENKQSVNQDITAASGKIIVDSKNEKMKIILYDYNIIDYKDNNRINGKELDVNIDIGKSLEGRPLVKKPNDLTFTELMGRISLYNQIGLNTTELEVILNLRLAMGLSPIAFLLLGLPMAIRTSRSETSAGLFMSVIFAGAYFFFVIGCKSMSTAEAIHPQLLLWIPNIVYQGGGIYYLYKMTGK